MNGASTASLTFGANGALTSTPYLLVTLEDGATLTLDASALMQKASSFAVSATAVSTVTPGTIQLAGDAPLTLGAAGSAGALGTAELTINSAIVDATTLALTGALVGSATPIPSGSLPSANDASGATSTYNAVSSFSYTDALGNTYALTGYFANTGANAWQFTVFNAADASAEGGFPLHVRAASEPDADLFERWRADEQQRCGFQSA